MCFQKNNVMLFSALLCSIFFFSCMTNKIDNVINGMIYDGDNEPVSNASIFFEEKKLAESDIYGHFRLFDVRKLIKSADTEPQLIISKKGYESSSISFDSDGNSQLLYIRLYSSEQLLAKTEESLRSKNFDSAESFLQRAEKTGCDTVSAVYLRAVKDIMQNKTEDAVSALEMLLTSGEKEPYIYLLLADCYQFYLIKPEKATEYLKMYLTTSYNPSVEERLQSLLAETTSQEPEN